LEISRRLFCFWALPRLAQVKAAVALSVASPRSYAATSPCSGLSTAIANVAQVGLLQPLLALMLRTSTFTQIRKLVRPLADRNSENLSDPWRIQNQKVLSSGNQ